MTDSFIKKKKYLNCIRLLIALKKKFFETCFGVFNVKWNATKKRERVYSTKLVFSITFKDYFVCMYKIENQMGD